MRRILPLALALAALAAVPAASQSSLQGLNTRGPVNVEADRIEVQDRADRAIFAGNVIATQGNMTLTAGRITVAYSGGVGEGIAVQRLDASGGVTVRGPGESARGAFGVYDLNRRIITLLGGVELNRGGNTVRGGRLIIDLNSGRAVVDGRAQGGTGLTTSGAPGGRVSGTFTVPEGDGN